MERFTSLSISYGSLRVSWCSGLPDCFWWFWFLPVSGSFFLHCGHVQVLIHQGVRILCRGVYVSANEVSHRCPVLCCCLVEVGKLLLYLNQVVGYIAALLQCFLPLSEIGLGFDEVSIKGRTELFSCVLHNLQSSLYCPIFTTSSYVIRTSWVSVTISPAPAAKSTHSFIIYMIPLSVFSAL